MNVPPVPTSLERAASWAWRLLVCAAALLAVLVLLRYLGVIVLPTLIALTIAPALTPVAGMLRSRLRLGRSAAAVALAVGIAAVAGLFAVVATSVASQFDELVTLVSSGVNDIVGRLEAEPFNLSLNRTDDLQSTVADSWSDASGYLVTSVQMGAALVGGVVLAVAVLYFVIRDGAAFWDWILRRFAPEARPAIDRAGQRAWAVLGGFVRGTAIIALIDASLIGIGLWLLGVPLAFALALLVFIASFVPFVGAFVSGLVAVLVALAAEGWEIGLATLAIVLAVQFVEGNFLQPIIQSRTVDLHPAVILLAVAASASLFGILGAYLAVPATAVVFAVVTSVGSRAPRPARSRSAGPP